MAFLCSEIPGTLYGLHNLLSLLTRKHRQLNPEKSKTKLIYPTGVVQFKIQSAIALTDDMRWHVIEPAFEMCFERIIVWIQKTILYRVPF